MKNDVVELEGVRTQYLAEVGRGERQIEPCAAKTAIE
jgi:hypothetical protein